MTVKMRGAAVSKDQPVSKGKRVLEFIGNELGDDEKYGGDGVLEYIPVDEIVLVDQARLLGIPIEDVVSHAEGLRNLTKEYTGAKLAKFETIVELSKSIKPAGLIQPIVLYEENGVYKIVAGERRFLAHLLLKRMEIRALIKPKPEASTLKATRLIENIQREDLSLWEVINGLNEISDELGKKGEKLDAKYIQEMMGISQSGAYRYMSILNGPGDVLNAIENEKIVSVKLAGAISSVGDVNKRAELIEKASEGEDSVEGILAQAKPINRPSKSKSPTSRGAPLKAIVLGKTTNSKAVIRIMSAYLGEDRLSSVFGDLDLHDFKSIKGVWDKFIEMVVAENN